MTGGDDPIVAFFDRHPRGYDLQLPLERRALRSAAALAEPLAGARVIDLAAGTGGLSAAILERADRLSSLIAVDASPRMLARARVRLRPAGAPPVFVVADARSVPMADGCADVVAIGYLLHLLDPGARAEVLDEAYRLLRPGGLLVAVVHGSPCGRAGRIYRGAWGLLSRLLPRALVGAGPMTDLAPALAAAGFDIEASRRVVGVYWSEVVRARRPPAAPNVSTASGGWAKRAHDALSTREAATALCATVIPTPPAMIHMRATDQPGTASARPRMTTVSAPSITPVGIVTEVVSPRARAPAPRRSSRADR